MSYHIPVIIKADDEEAMSIIKNYQKRKKFFAGDNLTVSEYVKLIGGNSICLLYANKEDAERLVALLEPTTPGYTVLNGADFDYRYIRELRGRKPEFIVYNGNEKSRFMCHYGLSLHADGRYNVWRDMAGVHKLLEAK